MAATGKDEGARVTSLRQLTKWWCENCRELCLFDEIGCVTRTCRRPRPIFIRPDTNLAKPKSAAERKRKHRRMIALRASREVRA